MEVMHFNRILRAKFILNVFGHNCMLFRVKCIIIKMYMECNQFNLKVILPTY